MNRSLDPQLRHLVSEVVACWGQVIRRNTSDPLYRKIETVRRHMAALRNASEQKKTSQLHDTYKILKGLSSKEQFLFAHSYALMLEVMNTCENAYRNYRLLSRKPVVAEKKDNQIIYVLTAHPTEARSPANVAVFHGLQELLVKTFFTGLEYHREEIIHQLETAWRLPIARQRKPRVEDEAEYIYSVVLKEEMIKAILEANREVCSIYLRSWVGGDKDGHPGVNEKTMVNSLHLSRKHLLVFIQKKFKEIRDSLQSLKAEKTLEDLLILETIIKKLHVIRHGDGRLIKQFRHSLKLFAKTYVKFFGALHPAISDLRGLCGIFPALAIPLELRESSDLVMEAAHSSHKKSNSYAINRMVEKLRSISDGGDPRWYVRGFIISMASQIEHVRAAMKILTRHLGSLRLPVIPLFEQQEAMRDSPRLVSIMLKDPKLIQARKRYWENNFEMMLGYSDSSKEMGVLQSRLLIAETVKKLDVLCRKHHATPVFFHGSGGSVDRGGGSLQEQTAWWPKSSLKLFKATIQGEMVERSFSSPIIFRNQVERISQEAEEAVLKQVQRPKAVDRLAANASKIYGATVHTTEFLEIAQQATPYRYLSALRIGSRPTKRGSVMSVESLRAIPWVLCWTQTRVLFPTWWGVGSAWKKTSPKDRTEIRRAFQKDPLFRTYIKILGFTLSKVELPIWQLYLEASGLPQEVVSKTVLDFHSEFQRAKKFTRAISGTHHLLWFRPWLDESIRLRSPMIHPLNLLQILILKKEDPVMIRETVAGISSGMMTTG